MKASKINLDKSYQLDIKNKHKHHIEDASKRLVEYYADQDKKKRTKEEFLCRYCYYYHTDRVGGSAMTTRPCANCEEDAHSGNTCVDVLCKKCAEEIKHCRKCGKKMD